jgi:UDP-N-acetylglucosamine--N-acetylmuramyl-(pentapeptide) pyrophosphoryl-undecaprenol N-acetylglucosamine transferase
MHNPKVIISGGGTGGHVFPAIAIANALKQINPSVEILFVGAEGKMEMEKVPQAGFTIIGLPIMGLHRRLTAQNLKFPFKLLASMLKARKIVKDFAPDVAVGVGGYASGPTLKAAMNKKVPCLIQEQNSFAGVTNKILGQKAKTICVAYDGMSAFFPKERIILTGNPVRQEVVKLEGKRERAIEFFGLDPKKKTVLVVGGSLGARSINHGIEKMIDRFEKEGVQLIWQTGKLFSERAAKAVAGKEHLGIKTMEFITKMDLGYAAADLVISRAGAIAVSELCLVKKPAILVPLPSAAEDHQTKNAMALVNHKAAELVTDIDIDNQLESTVFRLISNEEELGRLSFNIAKLGMNNSAEIIANEVLKLVKK